MNTIIWVLQILIAGAFMYSGINKSIYSEQKLITIGQTGVEGLSPSLIHFIGIIEILGAAGLTLPSLIRVLPMITPISAVGFAIIMILACRIHYKRKEYKNALNNILLLIICFFVAWYRFNSLAP
ncbi:MAG TPA: DoxX family protein [Puia sp.]|nr:DoxX family protein [Puia sp.]